MAASQRVFRTAQIRVIESRAIAAVPPPPLMEWAGVAAAREARAMLGAGSRVLVLAGAGNNGGDALVAARHLRDSWLDVRVVLPGDAAAMPTDAAAAFAAWQVSGGITLTALPPAFEADLLIDGLFGIGLTRPVTGVFAESIERMNAATIPVLALDVPSGIDADTGRVLGCAVRATTTITFIALKPGLLTLDGPDHAGYVVLDSLGLDTDDADLPGGIVLDASVVRRAIAPRTANSHKGSYGTVGIIGGAPGMVGAALLAARAALHAGAGKVVAGMLADDAPSVDPVQPELMLRTVREASVAANVLVVGPGLGQSEAARRVLQASLEVTVPLVLDADALNLIAGDALLASQVARRIAPTVITPHPAEAARLLQETTTAIQADRIDAAVRLAQRLNAFVVLKGAGSICAAADGTWCINTTGNPGLASAGTGDVLAGLVGALIAQGAAPFDALQAAVHVHGLAADRLKKALGGPLGITASALVTTIPLALNEIVGGGAE